MNGGIARCHGGPPRGNAAAIMSINSRRALRGSRSLQALCCLRGADESNRRASFPWELNNKRQRNLGHQLFSSNAIYTDASLIWGRAHPGEAQQCLQVPPYPSMASTSEALINLSHLSSLEEYLRWRNWNFPLAKETDLPHAKALVSHLLSAPLTLGKFYDETFDTSILSTTRGITSLSFHWLCIGARAEAMLPVEFWQEMLIAITQCHQNSSSFSSGALDRKELHVEFSLDFLGPDVDPQMPDTTLTYENSQLHLKWLYKGFLHDYVKHRKTAKNYPWSAFILLNPGLAHPHLVKGWEQTIDFLLRIHRDNNHPILLTAHSSLDGVRDWNLLQSKLQTSQLPPFRHNPFASHITYEDPFDPTHMVQPNHSYLILEQ